LKLFPFRSPLLLLLRYIVKKKKKKQRGENYKNANDLFAWLRLKGKAKKKKKKKNQLYTIEKKKRKKNQSTSSPEGGLSTSYRLKGAFILKMNLLREKEKNKKTSQCPSLCANLLFFLTSNHSRCCVSIHTFFSLAL
jgi:hypothetical protein